MSQHILKKADIDAMPGLEKTHFLNPKAKRNNKSLGDMTGLTSLGFHRIEVPPGAVSTEFHRHHYEDECTYVLSGIGEVRIGDTWYPIAAGDFIGYPKGGDAHTMKNTGSEPLICLVAGQRLAHDVCDYPDLGKRLYRNAGQPWNMVDLDTVEYPQGSGK
jgi:uncharacterized cupin superfamily protein